MRNKLTIGLFCALCAFVVNVPVVQADGKFYAKDVIPPDIPYQRAVISYQNGEELLILQSKFEGAGKDFGWVVPVPDAPKMGSIDKESARHFFRMWSFNTAPKVISMSEISFGAVFIIWLFLILIFIVERISCAIRNVPVAKFFRGSLISYLIVILLGLFILAGLAIPNLVAGKLGMEMLSEQQVGVYDVKVIKASDAGELIKWLNDNQYKFSTADEAAFNAYIQKGWCFVTVRISAEEQNKDEFRSWDGMVNPLVMAFKSKEMVYPLALTTTIGKETEVLLYVFGEHKMAADDRFTLEFARTANDYNTFDKLKIESKDGIDVNAFPKGYLSKLKGRLTAEQMKDDLILKPAPDDKPYREHLWRW